MVKIGWIGLQINTFHHFNQSVGKQPSMNECARVTINASGLGTSVMTEGQVLLLTIAFVIVITLLTNAVVGIFI
jgi:hypothetical protein|tara:strand:- start:66 stop:287 length:222 start_codon:yes stop_codon:yes gene_type:complete